MDNSYVFTPCGASGRFGPTQTQVNAGYGVGNPLSGQVVVNNGIQQWIVPQDGMYTIEARGAQGGTPYTYLNRGGYGVITKGVFYFKKGQILKIAVGQMGGCHTHDGGGGGGTFVTKIDSTAPYLFAPTNERVLPLVVAGGGGGGSYTSSRGQNASLTTDGTQGTMPSNGVPGRNGNGAVCATNGYASAGAGFLTNGSGSAVSNVYHGVAFLNGAVGGASYAGYAVGGFGGGGGTHGQGWGGGGGGGFSGGTTSQSSQYGGGGGGSYNDGQNKSFAIGNCGDGVVIITAGGLYSRSEDIFVFTSCGASGRLGPTQNQVSATYAFGNPLSGKVASNNGIQTWTVPRNGVYSIEVRGAQGGNNGNGPGRGTVMKGNFELTAGTILSMIVGQQGTYAYNTSVDAGGGGGTFVTKGANPLTSEPLIIAGGGGGSSNGRAGKPGLIYTNGGQGDTPAYAGGGINGQGGGHSSGYGGGGFYTNGQIGTWNSADGGQGYAFRNGGAGGNTRSVEWAIGGFGGGAGAHGNSYIGGGGGGGYSGGGGGGYSGDTSGGGGGSYNIGKEQYALSGINSGDGLIIISMLYSLFYFVEQNDRLYMTSSAYYDELTDTFFSIPKSEVFNYVNDANFMYTSTANTLFQEFKLFDASGISYRTVKPIDYFNLKIAKIYAVSLQEINYNRIRINYKVNKDTLINKCQIQLANDIVIANKIYDRHFIINSTKFINTMIKKYEKYYNENLAVDTINNILRTGIPANSIMDYNIESDVINLSIAFNNNIYNAADKLKEIKLIAKTGNNYRKLMHGEIIIANNLDKIFIKFKDANNEVIINALHKNPSRNDYINTLEEF